MFSSQADITKMASQYANYAQRNSFYFIRAPRNGFITKAIKTGIGEIIKEGEAILTIMPKDYQPAVEFYITPMDAPLIHKGKKIRFQFDGIPAFVISGWSAASTGTFGGEIVAVDNFLSENGKFRALAVQDLSNSKPWPINLLRIGTGARGLAILEDVSVGYELWRKANGMPPEFYDPELFDYHEDDIKKKYKSGSKPDKIKFKAPVKSIK